MVYLKHVILILCVYYRCLVQCIPSFTSWPEVVGSYIGKSATLTWTLSEVVNKDWDRVELLYNKLPTSSTICGWYKNDPDNVICKAEYQTRATASISDGYMTIRLTLYDIQPDDVTYNYICSIRYDFFSPSVTNKKGWIILFNKPDTPDINASHNPPDVVQNTVFSMRCSARSTSILPSNLPTDLKPIMEYRWQRDKQDVNNDDRHRVSGEDGNTLTIDKIQREDNKRTYTCIAQESGSKLSSSKAITLNVMYKPGKAQAESNKVGPYFEHHPSDIRLSCSMSDPGNPQAVFKWSKDGINKGQNNQGHYTISRGQLSVSGHDGVWQCTPYNRIGEGQPDTINVIVYAKPVFTKNLSNQSPRAEIESDLDVLCSIRGRPAPDVTWQYNDNDLPDGVTDISESVVIKDKLTTVNRRLRWSKKSALHQRRSTSGVYTCIGRVENKQTKQSINVDVQYGPYNTKIIPSGIVTKTENDSLSLTCAATCNPACNYRWTRDNKQVSVGDKLLFTSIKREHQGHYRCTASNGIGTDEDAEVNIQVNYPPELITILTPGGDIIQESEVTMTCIVDSRPEPSSITWTNITVPGLAPVGCSEKNNTHCWLTLSNINILDSGTYQCQAENGVRGSPVSITKTITVYGPARWYKVDPVDFVKGVSIGNSTSFKVWIIARPLPEQDQWQWKFSPSNSSNVMTTNPGHVQLTVSGDMAVLSITDITFSQYGNYYIWTNNNYGGWNEGDMTFKLKPQGPPLKPTKFSVIHVTAVSIRVHWITGFNGGLEQTFTIRYTNVASRVVMEKSGIEDRGAGDGQMITDDITDGIEPETEYQLQIFAVNSQGQTTGDVVSTKTPALAKFQKKPEIKIKDGHAEIHFIIGGQLTHIKVENCVEDSDSCVTENVTVPDKTRKKRQTTKVLHDFSAKVTIVDPDAKRLNFTFWIYDGDVFLTSEQVDVNINNDKGSIMVITGAVLGILVAAVIAIILIALWRKGFLKRKNSEHLQHTESFWEEETAEGHANAMFTQDADINPYVTSQEVGESVVAEVTKSSSYQSNSSLPVGEVGPITGDIYAGVKKKTKVPRSETQKESPKPRRSNIQQSSTRPVSVYPPENVESSESQASLTAAQSEAVYAKVDKTKVKNPKSTGKGNKTGSPKKKQPAKAKHKAGPYVNVMNTDGKDGVYSEVQVPHLRLSNVLGKSRNTPPGAKDADEPNLKPIKLIGEDGIVYADLEIFNQPPSDPDKIHGAENLVQYASIEFPKQKK